MVHHVVLPDLGEGIAEGQVLEWLVGPGQEIATDDPLAEVATDKVDVVIPSPVAGIVGALCVDPGQVVPVGTVLAEITVHRELRVTESTAIRELAERLDVDLATIRPPGPRQPVGGRSSGDRRQRATIARRLTQAAAVPVVTNVDEVDFESVRAAGRAPLAAVARAVVLALGAHPQLNAWGDDTGTLREQDRVHLGIATQAPSGLVVPVVRDADRLTTDELAQAITDVSTAACEGRGHPEDLGGSTFTITSAGRNSGLFATPLLNLPEVAILGLYRVQQRAVVRDGAIVARHTANLSVSFDHRAIDGVTAANFLGDVIERLETWAG